MSDRQTYVDRVRKLQEELNAVLLASKFTKESERFMLREAMIMLERVESYLSGYLQVDKFRGN